MDIGKYYGLGFGAGDQRIKWEKRATNKINEGRLIYLNLFLYLFVTPGSLDSHDYSI